MALYAEHCQLDDGHVDGIACIAFSCFNSYIASGGFDHRLCIWSLKSAALLHQIVGSSPVLSLLWIPTQEDTLLGGLQDGTIIHVIITPDRLVVRGFWAHNRPVEHLAHHPARKAQFVSAAHGETSVWSQRSSSKGVWVQDAVLDEPLNGSSSDTREVIVTSLSWAHTKKHVPELLISYMYHGVIVVDTLTWNIKRSFSPDGCIAHAAISGDGHLLAVSNLETGFDIYRVRAESESLVILRSLATVVDAVVVPLLFMHEDRFLLTGSTEGVVRLWDTATGQHHQSLCTGIETRFSVIAANHSPHGNSVDAPRFVVAAAAGKQGSSIAIWMATAPAVSTRGRRTQDHTESSVTRGSTLCDLEGYFIGHIVREADFARRSLHDCHTSPDDCYTRSPCYIQW